MIELRRVIEARESIKNQIRLTPCWPSAFLSDFLDAEVYLKLENFQTTGSYKERGALNRLLQLTSDKYEKGVVAASAGNHGQAVAFHAHRLGIKATVFMPHYTPQVKVERTRSFGADIVFAGGTYDEAYQAAQIYTQQKGAEYIHAYDDPYVIAGQGTVGLELLEQFPAMDTLIAPIGGGGLMAGLAAVCKSHTSSVELIGVESSCAPSMAEAMKLKKTVSIPIAYTIADGIAVSKVGDWSLEQCMDYGIQLAQVTDGMIANGILNLLERHKIVAEGAGAAGVGYLLDLPKESLKGKRIAVIVSGGNIDVNQLTRVIERGLINSYRIMRFQVLLKDRPGRLSEILRGLGELQANVLKIYHDRAFTEIHWNEVRVELVLETRGQSHVEEIIEHLKSQAVQIISVGPKLGRE